MTLQRVIAAVICREDKLLVCQRPAHKRHGGLWEFPGGKLEEGEDDERAARRELREELGVEVISVGATAFESRDPDSPFLIAFVPVEIVGEPQAHEHAALVWGTVDELQLLACCVGVGNGRRATATVAGAERPAVCALPTLPSFCETVSLIRLATDFS
jgi:8-oxo-dGTP diphosphatase